MCQATVAEWQENRLVAVMPAGVAGFTALLVVIGGGYGEGTVDVQIECAEREVVRGAAPAIVAIGGGTVVAVAGQHLHKGGTWSTLRNHASHAT